MVAYCLQLHPKDQHFHGDDILESLVEVLEANSLVVEHLEIWEENGHMMGGFLEDQKDWSFVESWMFQRETEIGV